MPMMPLRPCRRPGCPELTDSGYCPQHTAARRAVYDREQRPERHAFYASAEWRRLRDRKIRQTPWCQSCERAGRHQVATIVHHIATIEDRPDRKLDIENTESQCASCHGRQHVGETFGRKRRKTP